MHCAVVGGSVHSAVCSVQYAVCIWEYLVCAGWIVKCAVYSDPFAAFKVQCKECSVQ